MWYLFESLAFAGEASHGGAEFLKGILFSTINVGLLVGVLVYFLRSPFRNFLKGRKEKWQSDIETAQKNLHEAQDQYRECHQRLRDFEEEVQMMYRGAQEMVHSYRQKMEREAQGASEQLRRETELLIKQEFSKAREEIRQLIVENALDTAESILKERMGSSDHKKIINEFVSNSLLSEDKLGFKNEPKNQPTIR